MIDLDIRAQRIDLVAVGFEDPLVIELARDAQPVARGQPPDRCGVAVHNDAHAVRRVSRDLADHVARQSRAVGTAGARAEQPQRGNQRADRTEGGVIAMFDGRG